MDIRERAAAALVRARAAGIPVPATDPPHRQRLRAALTRDIAALLALPAGHVVVGDDPIRTYGGVPGQLITVEDPGDPAVVLRLLPETGNIGTGGGAYLLLDACPGCSRDRDSGDVPVMADHRPGRSRPLPALPAAAPRSAGACRVLRRSRPRLWLPTAIVACSRRSPPVGELVSVLVGGSAPSSDIRPLPVCGWPSHPATRRSRVALGV